jgi:NAD(P)-dependent dehydrogenase (short-subunit alcohol dehydrogenase family)
MTGNTWGTIDIPDQTGRTVVVTGATSGIGKEAARVLAGKNASVVIAARNEQKAQSAADEIRRQYPGADVTVRVVDLASLSSIEEFSRSFNRDYDRLDVLINNAGIMMCPYGKTADAFEIQFGTNHLGHFALTGRLLPLLERTSGSRVVMVSSLAHRAGNPDFSDLNWQTRRYKTTQAYADSKLANMYMAFALAEKLEPEGNNPLVTAAHPGWTATELQRHASLYNFLNRFLAQGVDMGALPTLRAAIDPDAAPGDFFGPANRKGMSGPPIKVEPDPCSRDMAAARKLWQLSEEMTGVRY